LFVSSLILQPIPRLAFTTAGDLAQD
jgi:hypothetical protein